MAAAHSIGKTAPGSRLAASTLQKVLQCDQRRTTAHLQQQSVLGLAQYAVKKC